MAIIDGCIGYWKLDESSGDAVDAVGTKNGTVSGAVQNQSGHINTSYDFDGADDHITFGTGYINDNFSGAAAISVSAWVYTNSAADTRFIFNSYFSDAGHTAFAMYVTSSDTVLCAANPGTGGSYQSETTTGTISEAGAWTHVVGVCDFANDTISIYINGTVDVNAASNDFTNASFVSGSGTTYADTISSTSSAYDGNIDEIGIWNKALTAAEVTSLYNSGNGLAYPFSEGTNCQINIGDAWKSVEAMQINIGDTWKAVEGAQINIGDAWKTIF